MSNLSRAISIANIAHAGQKDLGGEPYILHPLRIMLQCQTESLRIVAILHDVVEDSERCTLTFLKGRGFKTDVLEAIQCLTKIKNEPIDSYMSRVLSNPLSSQIKRLDLKDNINIARIPNPTPKDYSRLEKYQYCLNLLEGIRWEGDEEIENETAE